MDKSAWTYKRLDEVCDKGSSNIVINRLESHEGDYPLYGASGIVKSIDFYHQEKPYIGIVKDGSGVGRVNTYPAYSSLVGTMQYILPKDGEQLKYIKYFLEKLDLSHLVTGAAIPHIYFKDYGKKKIPIPSKEIQRRIVGELDAINESILLFQQQVEDLDLLAQSFFYDMFGDPTENPKHWQVMKVGDMASEIKYGTSSPACENGQYKYLRMCNLTYNGYLDLSDIKTINISETEIEKYIVRRGDILFNRTNSLDLIGKTCMFDENEPMVIAGYIIRVRLKKEILPVYFARAFNLPSIKSVLRKLAKGAVNQANINSKELASISLPIPPLELQKSFASKMIEIEASKSLLNAQITEMKSMLSGRMQYWFD